jgi:amidophosphoribosyltransferase
MEQRLGHACGVFGVYAPGQPVAHLAYLGLFALQHRGQESAGIAVSDGETITVVKDMGLVTQVFDERRLAPLDGHLAIGHNRYSTTGSSSWRNAQPVYRSVGDAGFALGHNGNLTNTVRLAESVGMLPGMTAPEFDLDSTTDSALVAELVAQEYSPSPRSDGRDLEVALEKVLPRLEGGFSFVLMDDARLIGVRDPHGFWPLTLGRIAGGWVLASESAALDIVGAHYVRDVEPGEMVTIDASGLRSHHFAEPSPKLCLFEFVYFSRPDTNLYGQSVHAARQRMGEELARQAPVHADMVMPVPESGIPAAQGFARASGIPYGDGVVKNRYIGRTFIAPTPETRAAGVRLKLNPIRENIAGKRLVVVDDSIVRGTTQLTLTRMLREAGAAEVHLRVTSPPYRWPCFYGMSARSASTSVSIRSPTSSLTGSSPPPGPTPNRSAPPASAANIPSPSRTPIPSSPSRRRRSARPQPPHPRRTSASSRDPARPGARPAHLHRRRRRHRGGREGRRADRRRRRFRRPVRVRG